MVPLIPNVCGQGLREKPNPETAGQPNAGTSEQQVASKLLKFMIPVGDWLRWGYRSVGKHGPESMSESAASVFQWMGPPVMEWALVATGWHVRAPPVHSKGGQAYLHGSARVAGRASGPPARRRTARAFSRWRLSSFSSSTLGCSPERAATQCASCRQVCMATGAQPPLAASATKGMNCSPSSAQVAAVCKWARLRASAARAPVAAEAATAPCRRPDVTAKSKAAGPWAPQLPTHTSAGRLPPPTCTPSSGAPPESNRGGSRPAFSTTGFNPPAWARAARTERRRWCLLVRSPPQGQALAWSPMQSAIPSQSGQATSSDATGSRKRRQTISRKSAGATCSPRFSAGGARNQAPAPGCCNICRWAR